MCSREASFDSQATARLRFAGELAPLVRRSGHDGVVGYPVLRRASIEDVVESLGVPHTEIYGVRVDGSEAHWDHLLAPGACVDLLPAVPPVDPARPTALRPHALPGLRFVVDENVAGMALLLRALGFDTAYDRTWDDEAIAALAHREGRFVFSRDRGLLKRGLVEWGRLVRSQDPDGQLAEAVAHLGITEAPALFSRCLRCNALTEPVDKASVLHRLEPKTRKYFNEFRLCPGCNRIYWRGSHLGHLRSRLEAAGVKID